MSELDGNGPELNIHFDHNRSIRQMIRDDQSYNDLFEQHRSEILRILSGYKNARTSLFQEMQKSRDERIRFVAEKMRDLKESYTADLLKGESEASSLRSKLLIECSNRVDGISEEMQKAFGEQINQHLRDLRSVYERASENLQNHIVSQQKANLSQIEGVKNVIRRTREELDSVRNSIRSAEGEIVSDETIHSSKIKYQQLIDEVFEADRESLAVKNFKKACAAASAKLHDIQSNIDRIQQTRQVGKEN